jgi:RNA polymerase sigma factor (sigma-70 family)
MQLPYDAAVPLIQVLTGEGRKQKVLVLVAVDDHESIVNCVAAGAQGCVLEEASLEELKVAIERVVAGETFCSQQLVSSMFQQLAELSRDSITTQRAVDVNLTPRERQILQLMADKMTNQEIADELSLSLYTVKNHVHNILEKLQVDDRFDAIEHARQRRLLPRVRPMPIAATRR